MPVHVTRRRNGIWYAGGAVRFGQQHTTVPEFSTGCGRKSDAEVVAARRDAAEREAIKEGPRITIGDCFMSYIGRPGGIRSYDTARVQELNRHCGHRPLSEAPAAWRTWIEARPHQKPGTVARTRAVFQAALRHGAEAHGAQPPRLPGVRGGAGEDRVVILTDGERKRLLAAYNPFAACPVLLMAYGGLRTQEALQLDWRRVDFNHRALTIPADQSKSGKARVIPMHARVDALLFGLWHAAGKPESGSVFLSSRGEPYADTRGRDGGRQGGNPLAQAHETACRIAGVTGFRVHDLRHDWAARLMMSGCDLRTLMDLGGWADLRMVKKYAAVTRPHMADAIGRLG